jgi:hypothetical protein
MRFCHTLRVVSVHRDLWERVPGPPHSKHSLTTKMFNCLHVNPAVGVCSGGAVGRLHGGIYKGGFYKWFPYLYT